MPIYDYHCDECVEDFEVVKSIKQHQDLEPCPKCQKMSKQDLSRCRFQTIGASVKDAYRCPALGEVIKSDYHRAEVAKKKGAVEVGNDFSSGEKMFDSHETARADKRKKAYEDL